MGGGVSAGTVKWTWLLMQSSCIRHMTFCSQPFWLGRRLKRPTRFLEGKQWIKIITGKVRADTDRPFMIRDYQRLGLFKSCSLTATEDLQAHNLVSSDRLWLSTAPFRPLAYWLLKRASDDSFFNKVHHCAPQVVHQQALKRSSNII